MPIIKRNTSAPVGAAGRAQGGGMRVPGSTLQRQQQDTAEDFKLAKSALNVGTAVVAGVNAGISGQTTKDIGALATQGIKTGNAEDAGGFDIAKFTDETVDTLGGVKGMLSGDISQQNIAGNIITNYQTGVSIGNAHAKQQGEALIATASGDADISFSGDMASGNYNGSADRAYQAQVNSLNQAMNDPNTTPAVKENIQSYLQNDLAKASFLNDYQVKQANAISKRTASNANALVDKMVDRGEDPLTVKKMMLEQQATGQVFRTPEQQDAIITQTVYNQNRNSINGANSRAGIDAENDRIQADENISATEKTYFKDLSSRAKSRVKAEALENLGLKRNDADFVASCQLHLELGNFKSPTEMNNFIKNQRYGEMKPLNPNALGNFKTILQSAKSGKDFEKIINDIATYKDTNMLSEFDKIQIDNVMSDAKKYLEQKESAIGTEMDQFMSNVMAEGDIGEERREELGVPEFKDDAFDVMKEDGGFLWFDKKDITDTDRRKAEFTKNLNNLKAQTQLIASEQERVKAKEFFREGYSELVKNANMPMYQREFQEIYSPNNSVEKRDFGSPKQVRQLNLAGVKADLKGGFKAKTETELRLSREAELKERAKNRPLPQLKAL